MSPFLVFLVLCFLPLHACNARFLGLFHSQITSRQHFITVQDLHALESNSIGNMNHKNLQALSNQNEALITQGNHELIIVSSQKDLPQKTKIKDLKRQERSMLGSGESKENDITEDIEVMDYAQPHRKPPIHNEKP